MPFKRHHCQLGLGSDSMLPRKLGVWANLYRSMRKMCQITQYHPETYDHFRSYPAVVAERQKHLYEGGKTLIHPLSIVSLFWHTTIAFVNLVHMFMSPLRLFFVLRPLHKLALHAVDELLLVLHALCLMDIVMKFNIGFIEESSNIVMNRKKIACRYLRRWFLLDLVSCLPVAFILLYLNFKDSQYLLVAHILPLLRSPRLYTAIVDLRVFMKIFTSSYIWHGTVRHAVLLVITSHWCTCLVYLPPVFSYYWFREMPLDYNRFLKAPDRNLLNIDIQNRYRKGMFIVLSAFFGTGFSMFRASEPDEIVIHALIILYSAMYMVYTLVFLLKVYMTTYSSTVRYHELMNQVEEYMTYRQFPAPLKKRVRAFYNYRYQQRYYREETALDCLSGTGFSMFRASEPDEIVIHALIILYSAMYMVYTLVFLLKVYMTTYSSTVRYHELMNQVEEYMTYRQFPAPLKKRVRAFYNYRYQQRYYREETALDCLSEELRNEITLHTCHKLVNKVALFEDVPASVVGSVLGCLRPEVYLPNDSVVRAGDIGDCMYFIANGTVAVYSLKGVEVCHLEDGAHFGEVALLMRDSKRVATVVAVEITQVYRLDADDFRHFLIAHQVLYERIELLASQRMHETVLLDEAFRKDRLSERNQGEIPDLRTSPNPL